MAPKNRVSELLKPDDLRKVLDALSVVSALLDPYLVTLPLLERKRMPKMNDGIVPFVQKTLEYAQSYAGFIPPHINVQELKNDFNIVETLAHVLKPVEQLYLNINDTMTLSGSEAYVASLDFYKSIRLSAKVKVPGAKVIAEDLKINFAEQVNRYSQNYRVSQFLRVRKPMTVIRN